MSQTTLIIVGAIIIGLIAFIRYMTKPAHYSSYSAKIDNDDLDPEMDPEKCLAPSEDMMPDPHVYKD